MYKMIVLDIDGTLLNSSHEITAKTKDALIRAQESGVKVVLASGRPTPGMLGLAEELNLKKYGSYISAYNGAEIIRMDTMEVVLSSKISVEDQRLAYDAAKENGVNIVTYEDFEIVTEDSDEYIDLEERTLKMQIKRVVDFKDYVQFGSCKCLMTAPPEKVALVLDSIKEEIGNRLNVATSAPFFIECTNPGVDKGSSLKQLAEILGIKLEEMVAFGDGSNDLSMLEIVGLPVAMGNANDAVKAISKYVTLSNDEDGIAHALDQFVLNGKTNV